LQAANRNVHVRLIVRFSTRNPHREQLAAADPLGRCHGPRDRSLRQRARPRRCRGRRRRRSRDPLARPRQRPRRWILLPGTRHACLLGTDRGTLSRWVSRSRGAVDSRHPRGHRRRSRSLSPCSRRLLEGPRQQATLYGYQNRDPAHDCLGLSITAGTQHHRAFVPFVE